MRVYNDLHDAREAIRVLIDVLPESSAGELAARIVDRPEVIVAIAEATGTFDDLMAQLHAKAREVNGA